MVEQRSPKPTVEGSSPSAPAKRFLKAPLWGFFVFMPCTLQVQPSFLLPFFAVLALSNLLFFFLFLPCVPIAVML